MNEPLPFNIVDDDLPFEADLAPLFRQSALPRRLEIDQLVDGCEPAARIRNAVHEARPRRARRWLAAATLAVCAALVIGLPGIFLPPKSALAQVAAQLQRVSSLRCSVMTTGLGRVFHGTLYWAASGSYRDEQTVNGRVVSVDIQHGSARSSDDVLKALPCCSPLPPSSRTGDRARRRRSQSAA